jgi:Arc/MetJ family transcription regulator
MRTTLDLPEKLINEAMSRAHIKTKTAVIKTALENLIQREKLKALPNYFGKVKLNIDLNKMRKR